MTGRAPGAARLALILPFLLLSIGYKIVCFAENPSASQIERTQELLREEEILRNKIEKEEKAFIEKIVVKGVILLNEDEIKEIILPFQKHWLSKTDIQQILDAIEQAYKEKGYRELPLKISFQIRKNWLEIDVEEK